MPEDLVVRHCAPTLAGLKTGNLFTASYRSEEELDEEIRRLNMLIGSKGLRITRLRARGGRALIYVYRPGQLQSDLDRAEARQLLKQFGYTRIDQEVCVARLARRICGSSDFPHEIGLFLGYPPEDVKGFIKYGGQGSKTSGYWKVYGDVDAANDMFRKFTKCTGVYLRCLKQGMPFEKLAVRKTC